MLNKKILAASIAAAVSFNASAVVDLNDGTTALKFATQTIANGTTLDLGAVGATTAFKFDLGLNLPVIAGGSEFFIRIELDNGKWATGAVVDGDLVVGGGTPTEQVAGGGAIGDAYVVFSYSNTAATASTVEATFTASAADITVADNTKPVTVTYKLYQNSDSLAALNGGAGEVASASLAAYTFATGQDVAKSFASNANTALVAKQFKEFAADTAPVIAQGKIASLGRADLTVATSTLNADTAVQVVEADVFTTPTTTATVTGDFSFGKTWWMSALDTCGTAAATGNKLVIAESKSSATVPSLNYTAGQSLCVEVDGTEVIPRNTSGYTVSLASNTGVEGTIGSITYDTTAITVPYVTTFADYNQRIYIQNNSSVDAPYTTTFQLEDGVTATAGSAAVGTVPAKTMIAIKAVDLVTFTGKTRGAAVIEIEATASNVKATTQTVNLSDGSTDTVTLDVQ